MSKLPDWLTFGLEKTRDYLRTLPDNAASFDMTDPGTVMDGTRPFDCGSVACIGGHAYLKAHGADVTKPIIPDLVDDAASFVNGVEMDTPLHKLFYPFYLDYAFDEKGEDQADWDVLTPREAALAIDNYLAGADEPWRGIFHDDVVPYRNRTLQWANGVRVEDVAEDGE